MTKQLNTARRFITKGLLLAALPLLITGCAMTKLQSSLTPGAKFDELGKTFVAHFEPDKRDLHSIIADKLTLMGHPATAGEKSDMPDDIDTLVTYKDHWMWDITNYMIRLNIQFRNGKSNELIITGESYRTSLARKSPAEMIEETLMEILKKRGKK